MKTNTQLDSKESSQLESKETREQTGIDLKYGSSDLKILPFLSFQVVAIFEESAKQKHDSIGLDLVPRPPLVVKGDFHAQPFDAETFDFEFSNVFDHALYPEKFVGEIERTLKPGGVCVIHVSLHGKTDKYSANDLYSVKPLVKLFKRSKVVEVRKIDGFGLDTEVVFRKNKD
ncbi:hypothetical protein F2Q68_00030108 [Brassica cretica]|uniref:Methyltransferase type 11 domain-containing protein n=1 Tax=Brassica cretica TaxID=69181 RepID=A0A8S9G872_BRACR|nr:hypothetical protein F2Q68_00030108 [Brassica cretica]